MAISNIPNKTNGVLIISPEIMYFNSNPTVTTLKKEVLTNIGDSKSQKISTAFPLL